MNFVYTSAGDRTEFYKNWISSTKTFDLYVTYYGDSDTNYELYKSHVTYIDRHKGSKFQNFYRFYTKHQDILEKYDRFFILDDDILFSCEDINKMFEISRKYDLEICQPSFSRGSLVSHPVTRHKKNVLLQYTNFVEVNTPLFTRESLDKLTKWFHPDLIGWGIDYLYIWANGINKKKSYAVIHCVQCINPKLEKGATRELYLIKDAKKRRQIWEAYAKTIACPLKIKIVEYEKIDEELLSEAR